MINNSVRFGCGSEPVKFGREIRSDEADTFKQLVQDAFGQESADSFDSTLCHVTEKGQAPQLPGGLGNLPGLGGLPGIGDKLSGFSNFAFLGEALKDGMALFQKLASGLQTGAAKTGYLVVDFGDINQAQKLADKVQQGVAKAGGAVEAQRVDGKLVLKVKVDPSQLQGQLPGGFPGGGFPGLPGGGFPGLPGSGDNGLPGGPTKDDDFGV